MRRPSTRRLPSIGEEPSEQCRRSAFHSARAGSGLPRAPSPGAGGTGSAFLSRAAPRATSRQAAAIQRPAALRGLGGSFVPLSTWMCQEPFPGGAWGVLLWGGVLGKAELGTSRAWCFCGGLCAGLCPGLLLLSPGLLGARDALPVGDWENEHLSLVGKSYLFKVSQQEYNSTLCC